MKNSCAAQNQKEKEGQLRRKVALIIKNERNTKQDEARYAGQVCGAAGAAAGLVGLFCGSLPLAVVAGAAVIGLARSHKNDAELLDHFMFSVKEQGKVDFYSSDEFLTLRAILDESGRVASRGGRLKLGR